MPRWPEEPLAQLSWASSPWHRRRRRTSATRHVVARLSVETHVHRAAARRLPSRRAASQRRGSGDNTPGRRCMGNCAGRAVLKKIAARFLLGGLRARIDTIAHATESHGVRRATVAVARRTGAQRACRVVRLHTADRQRDGGLRSKARLDTGCPAPSWHAPGGVLVGLSRVRRSGLGASRRRGSARGVTCDT